MASVAVSRHLAAGDGGLGLGTESYVAGLILTRKAPSAQPSTAALLR